MNGRMTIRRLLDRWPAGGRRMVLPSALLALFLSSVPTAEAAPPVPSPRMSAPAGTMPPAAPARPDTVRLGFVAVDSLPAPLALHVLADTVAFGGLLPVAWDLPASGGKQVASVLPKPDGDVLVEVEAPRTPWWRPGRRGGPPADDRALAALPPTTGRRVVAHYRVYRADPFRLEWAGRSSAVIVVRGRVEDPSAVAAVRDPRRVGWLTATLVLVLGAIVLAAVAAWWWWRRRTGSTGPADWPLPEPAWIEASLALRQLLARGHLDRGEVRLFLDGLAGVARGFAAAHYGVPALELTGRELVAACGGRGFAAAGPAALASLIEGADLNRYDPVTPAVDWCRGQAVELLGQLADERVLPRQTPVTAERLLAAQKAWAELTASLGARPFRSLAGKVGP